MWKEEAVVYFKMHILAFVYRDWSNWRITSVQTAALQGENETPDLPHTVWNQAVKHLTMTHSHVYCIPVSIYASTYEYRSAPVFQKCRSHPKIPGTRRTTWSKFHTEDPQILGTTVQNLVTTVSWYPGIVHPCINIIWLCGISCSWNQQNTFFTVYGCESTLLCFFLHSPVLLFSSTPMHLSILNTVFPRPALLWKYFSFLKKIYGSLDQQNTHTLKI